jgi:hypothetical protein
MVNSTMCQARASNGTSEAADKEKWGGLTSDLRLRR